MCFVSRAGHLKEADAFQRLVWDKTQFLSLRHKAPQRSRRLSASGIDWRDAFKPELIHTSKKQTPFSVWYVNSRAVRGGAFYEPQRSRRLSASGMDDRKAGCSHGILPQRSRRLSASGINGGGWAVARQVSASKKQTPFSVWYDSLLLRPMASGRNASKKQTPFSVWYARASERRPRTWEASKKQTPFSVWYAEPPHVSPSALSASKKQTPFSVWYAQEGGDKGNKGLGSLKEADAFQRLVSVRRSPRPPRFQHASKKQTPFSVWYMVTPRLLSSGNGASKKQTPFSVWYRVAARALAAANHASKKQTPFSVWYGEG